MGEFTPERLEREIRRFRMTPEQARERLLAVRAIIDGLLTTRSDVQRIRLYERFMKRLCRGWSSPDNLMYWSKIGGLSAEEATHLKQERADEIAAFTEAQHREQLDRACSHDETTTLP